MSDIDYDKLAAAILRQQKQQQQQQAESKISTRNADKSSLNDILTSSCRQSIDIQLFKQLIYNSPVFEPRTLWQHSPTQKLT